MKAKILGTLLVAALVAPPAEAEPPTGSRLGERLKPGHPRADPDAVRTGHRLAACLYLKRTAEVVRFLNTVSDEESRRYARTLSRSIECSSVTLADPDFVEGTAVGTSSDIWRGMLAEAALGKMGHDIALEALPTSVDYRRDWFAVTGRPAAVDEMAVCTADRDPAGVRALMATTPEAPEERVAVQALSPTLGPCLPQGATLKANRLSLRAALAEALYHRAVAPPRAAAPATR